MKQACLIFDEDDFEIGLNYAERHHEPMQQAEYLNREQLDKLTRISIPNLNKPCISHNLPMCAIRVYYNRSRNI